METDEQLKLKEQAITAGLVVELEPEEADALRVDAMEEAPTNEEELQALLDSRFDPCEFDLALEESSKKNRK